MFRLTFSSCRTCPSVSIRFHLAVGVRICMSGRLSTAGPMRIKIPSSSLIPLGSSLRVKSIHQTHPRLHKIIIIITVFTYAAKVDTNNYLKPFIHVCTLLNEQTKEVHRRDVLSRTTGTFVQIFEKLFTTCLASRLNEHLSSLNPLASGHKWPANNS